MSEPAGIPPIFGINTGPVRPLGKSPNFDQDFDRLMDDLSIARRQGLIDITASYDLSTSSRFTIGAVSMGSYPLNPTFLLWAYRNIARDSKVLLAAIEKDNNLFGLPDEVLASVALSRAAADSSINNDPALPLITGDLRRDHLRQQYSEIARARLAATIKLIGYCAAKKVVPFFGSSAYSILASHIAKRANDVIDKVTEQDPYWASRSQVIRIAHEEYIDETVLNAMSLDDVLSLRTRAWGEQAAAREEMLTSVAELSKELGHKDEFPALARERIVKYRAKAEELTLQRSSLGFKMKCDIVKATSGFLAGSTISTGLFTQMQTAIGAATTLLAGCMYTAEKVKEHLPVSRHLRMMEEQFKDDAGDGLHNFYTQLDNSARG